MKTKVEGSLISVPFSNNIIDLVSEQGQEVQINRRLVNAFRTEDMFVHPFSDHIILQVHNFGHSCVFFI